MKKMYYKIKSSLKDIVNIPRQVWVISTLRHENRILQNQVSVLLKKVLENTPADTSLKKPEH